MKVLVHDYSGHPFQAQLSRELARRGHEVEHVHCASYVSGKGQLERSEQDPISLTYVALGLGKSFDKYTLRRRLAQERAYAKTFVAHVDSNRPDVVLMCNVPLMAHALIKRQLLARGIPTVFWHQDVYSHAIGVEARRRLGLLGTVVARGADRAEARIARRAQAVVAISDHFIPVHRRWGTEPAKLHVIPNWGPLDEVVPRPRDNAWASEHDLVGRPVLMYSGTLGLKHDPTRLVTLLRGVRERITDAQLVVVSDGPVADTLRSTSEPGLTVVPFQPFDQLSDVLGSADLLLTILEPEASEYSVPSKTLTYLCAGRPVVALLPRANPGYDVVSECGGLAIDVSEVDMATVAVDVAALLANRSELERRGLLARAYAERTFDLVRLTDRFEALLAPAPNPGVVNLDAETPAVVALDTGVSRA